MKFFASFVVLIVCFCACAQATLVTTSFTFDGLCIGTGSRLLSDYMTEKYGADITIEGAWVGALGFTGNICTQDRYITTSICHQGYFDICFAEPITSVSFDWYVFNPTEGADFEFTAYDYDNNVIGQPLSAELADNSWCWLSDDQIDRLCWFNHRAGGFAQFQFYTPVSCMKFSDHGVHDVGIDNLTVVRDAHQVPEPAAVSILSLAVLLLTTRKRRRSRISRCFI